MDFSTYPFPPLCRGEKSRVIIIGKYSYGVENIRLLSWAEGANCYVGSFNSIGNDVQIFLGGYHRHDWATTFPFGFLNRAEFPHGDINGSFDNGHLPYSNGHVLIENDVWIGANCTIMNGVALGSGSVIAANSVVTKDVMPYSIIGGNPAKLIKRRFQDQIIEQLLELKWWDLEDDLINQLCPLLQTTLNNNSLKEIQDVISMRQTRSA